MLSSGCYSHSTSSLLPEMYHFLLSHGLWYKSNKLQDWIRKQASRINKLGKMESFLWVVRQHYTQFTKVWYGLQHSNNKCLSFEIIFMVKNVVVFAENDYSSLKTMSSQLCPCAQQEATRYKQSLTKQTSFELISNWIVSLYQIHQTIGYFDIVPYK